MPIAPTFSPPPPLPCRNCKISIWHATPRFETRLFNLTPAKSPDAGGCALTTLAVKSSTNRGPGEGLKSGSGEIVGPGSGTLLINPGIYWQAIGGKSLYGRVTDIFGEEIGHYIHNNWKRFLDDCYINWPYGEEKLDVLHRILNSLNDNIRLTVETSCVELPFLDVMVKKEGTRLTSDIYYKPTDSFQYLPYTSSHPRHTKNNTPYNLARRICMIIENREKREQCLHELKYILLSKKYREMLLILESRRHSPKLPRNYEW